MPHAKGGRVRVLATTGLTPDPLAPELPTVAETVPGYESTQWFGIALPARTPKPIIFKLHAEIMKALRSPDVAELLSKQGATADPMVLLAGVLEPQAGQRGDWFWDAWKCWLRAHRNFSHGPPGAVPHRQMSWLP